MECNIMARTLFTVHSVNDELFYYKQNTKFAIHGEEEEYQTDRFPNSQASLSLDNDDAENGTPAPQIDIPSFLRITTDSTHDPKNTRSGFVFGCDKVKCDVLLDEDRRRGISGEQFAIQLDWEARTLTLKNLSKRGTCIQTPLLGYVRLYKEQTLTQKEILTVKLGSFAIQIQPPSHDHHEDAFRKNWDEYRTRLALELPSLQQLDIKSRVKTNTTLDTDYYIGVRLGRGSSATVYRATERSNGRPCAVKQFHRHAYWHPQEVKILDQLKHEHIIRVYSHTTCGGLPFIAMELGGGPDLQEVMATDPLNGLQVRSGLRQLLEALDYLHGKGITHRDIKPANIIVHRRDPVCFKLTDFGEAAESDSHQTYVGTSCYRAPELTEEGCRHYTNKVDIWSLGVVALGLFYPLPEMSRDNPHAKKWHSILVEYLAGQEAKGLKWRFISSLLEYDPLVRPSAKQSLEHEFFKDHSLTELLEYTPIPTRSFNEGTTVRNTEFYTARQSPQAEDSSSELSTLRPAVRDSVQDSQPPCNYKLESSVPSASHREGTLYALSSNNDEDESLEDTAACMSESDDGEDSVILLKHDNPLRNPLFVGSMVAKMGKEAVSPKEDEDSNLPPYEHMAQSESPEYMPSTAPVSPKSDGDGLAIGQDHEQTATGSIVNSGDIDLSDLPNHPLTVNNVTTQAGKDDTEAHNIGLATPGSLVLPELTSFDFSNVQLSSSFLGGFGGVSGQPLQGGNAMNENEGETQNGYPLLDYAPTPTGGISLEEHSRPASQPFPWPHPDMPLPSTEQNGYLVPAPHTWVNPNSLKRAWHTEKAALKRMFDIDHSPSKTVCAQIAVAVSLDADEVSEWFERQRGKLKRKRIV